VVDRGTGWRLLTSLVVALRSLALWCGGRWAVALENLALRQQLTVFKRTMKRPPLRSRDRRSGGCSQDGLQELVERCDPGGSVAHSSICARGWSREMAMGAKEGIEFARGQGLTGRSRSGRCSEASVRGGAAPNH